MKRKLKKGQKVFTLGMRCPAVVIRKLDNAETEHEYMVRSEEDYGVGHESEDHALDLIPLAGHRDAERNRALVKQLEAIIKKLEE